MDEIAMKMFYYENIFTLRISHRSSFIVGWYVRSEEPL